MRNRAVGSVFGMLAVFALWPAPALAQTAPKPGAAKPAPDLSGIWTQARSPSPGRRFSNEDPPLQPWAMEVYKANRKGVTDFGEQGLDELDPNTYCFPAGPARSMILPFPFEILQTPKVIYLLFEYDSGVRRVYADGRPHPEGWPFGWMGHSIGTWEGDTLVVDTVGLNDKTWIDRAGTPHSDALHIVERFRRVDHDTLEADFLFDDPKAFTKPWGGKKIYRLSKEQEVLDYVPCEEFLEIGKYREVHAPGQGKPAGY